MSTLQEIEAMVVGMDENLDRDSDSYRAAVCLLAALEVSADAAKVTEFTGYDPALVQGFADNLHRSNVWTEGGMTAANWWDDESGGIEFWMDVNVAMGLVEMRPKRD